MVNEKDKTDKTIKIESWLDGIDLDEIVETTNLNIREKYSFIPEGNFTTVRRVEIVSLPKVKNIEYVNKKTGNKERKDLMFMEISDDGVIYSLPANAITLRRSIASCAIKISNADTKEKVDMSVVLNKLVGLKRIQFKAKGFDAESLIFFLFE